MITSVFRFPQRVHFILTIIATALLLPGALVHAISEDEKKGDWPQFLGPHRDGTSDGPKLADTWPASGPPALWKADVGDGFAGPVVADGKVIQFHRLGDQETVDCLDAGSGKQLWRSQYPTGYIDDFGFDPGPRATPTVDRDHVYTFGAEGRLTCWTMADGKKVWSVATKEEYGAGKGFFGMASSPLVEGDAVIANIGGKGGAGVIALDRATGKLLWKATDDEASYASPIAATLNGKRRVLVFNRAGLIALEPSSGKVLFNFPWRPPMHASVSAATPLVHDDEIFLSASYNTGAILLRAAAEGPPQKLWSSDDSMSNHYATCVYHKGYLFGFHGRQEQGPSLRCIEWKTGKVKWSEDHFGGGSIILAGDRLIILTEKGQLILAPASENEFKPTAKAQILSFDSRAYPAFADGRLFAKGKDKLVCVDLRSK